MFQRKNIIRFGRKQIFRFALQFDEKIGQRLAAPLFVDIGFSIKRDAFRERSDLPKIILVVDNKFALFIRHVWLNTGEIISG